MECSLAITAEQCSQFRTALRILWRILVQIDPEGRQAVAIATPTFSFEWFVLTCRIIFRQTLNESD